MILSWTFRRVLLVDNEAEEDLPEKAVDLPGD